MNELVLGVVSFAVAAVMTLLFTPFLIKTMEKRKIVGKDMNKLSRPLVPEMGGIGVFFGISAGVMLALGVFRVISYFTGFSLDLPLLLAGMMTVLFVGFIGVFDDLIEWKNGIRKWQHALLPVFAALPMMVVIDYSFSKAIGLPFVGPVVVGTLYVLVLVPFAVTGASNAVNMLAGLNGLEAGLGAIISFSMLGALFMLPEGSSGKAEAIILMAATFGALFAFLKFNWVPAKIFGGDSLTLMTGASIAVVSIIAGIEKVGIMLFLLYFVELFLKGKHKMQTESFGIPQKDGTLLPDPRGGSFTHIIMGLGKFTEKKIVQIILGLQAAVSALVLGLFYLNIL